MESRGTVPAPVIGAEDVPDLAGLFEGSGPFATVYLDTDPQVEQAGQRSQARWRNLRRDLETAGAPSTALDAIEALVEHAHQLGHTLCVVAGEDGVLVERHEQEPVNADRAVWGPLPSVGTLLEWQQARPIHIVVLCDRVGADIALFAPDVAGGDARLSFGDDETDDPHLRKTKPGGWSQRRFQERAENSWEANMKAVCARLEKIVQIIEPRVVIVGGDVRAVQLLCDNMPGQLRERVELIDGQRAIDGGIDDVADDVVKLVASAVAEDTVSIIEKFREERGQNDRAADGIDDTLAALSSARVDTLLVHDDPSNERECWFSLDPPLAAPDRATLTSQGVDEPAKARAVDAAIAIAFRTGARVRVVPSTSVTDGLGAILRY